jgi:transposase
LILLQQAQITELQRQINLLMAKQEELTDRLNKNSRNSNKPPSSDGLKKPVSKPAFTRNKGRKSGGQAGHVGRTLEICETPDFFNELLPDSCGCGKPLDKSGATVVEVRQVFDLPQELRLEVTEHVLLGCTCENCGAYNEGLFPEGVSARLQYGHGVKALAVLLNVAFKLPLKKVQTLFADLFGCAINQGTIINATQRCFGQLGRSEVVLRNSLLQSIVNHFDETGLRVAGGLHWLHTCCNGLFTYLFVHIHRGTEALQDAASNLPGFKNWAVHDCWGSYFKFKGCLHAICGAHLVRELVALEEKGTAWATWFRRYLLALYHLSEQGKGKLSAEEQRRALLLFDRIWELADLAEPPPKKSESGRGKPKATKGRNLLVRLKKHQSAVLAFAFHEEVPFTNNQAERDLRPAKTKQKVAGAFRTFYGARTYARIFGFISTARKHELSVFNELKNAFTGETFLNRIAPS